MRDTLKIFVCHRANDACEYCGIPQGITTLRHELDHIIAEKHRGLTTLDNLAYACVPCNKHKEPT